MCDSGQGCLTAAIWTESVLRGSKFTLLLEEGQNGTIDKMLKCPTNDGGVRYGSIAGQLANWFPMAFMNGGGKGSLPLLRNKGIA